MAGLQARASMLARLAVLAVFLVVAVSGCSSKPPATVDEGPAGDASRLAPGGEGSALTQAPQWKVGQSWDHHYYFSPDDTTGFMVKAIVVSNGTDGYRLASDEALDAASHAAFYFHDQGLMGPDWTVRDDEGAFQFPWYSFPLTDGKTWTAQEENLDFNLQKISQQVTLKATAINGTPGAFNIEGRTSDGLRARYDYQPSIGWFSEYRAYDPKGDPERYNVRMVNEAQSPNWSGTYFTATATLLLNSVTTVVPTAPSPPPPPASFTMTEEYTHVFAIPFTFSAAGASQAELVAPDQRHWDSYSVTDPNGATLAEAQPNLVFEPAAVGEWRWETVGAGAFVAGGGCLAWGITLTTATL